MTNRYVMFALILAVVGSLLTAVLTLEDPESYRVGEIEKSADPIFNLYPRAETPIHIEPPR